MKTPRPVNTSCRLTLAVGPIWAQVNAVVQPVPGPRVASVWQQEIAAQLARANLTQQGIAAPTTGQLALATSDVQTRPTASGRSCWSMAPIPP